ncbi:hypothetical protein ABH941_004757 [Streptacidiphilus sp. EB103A]
MSGAPFHGSRPRPYLRLQVGGFECSLQDRPRGRVLKGVLAGLVPLCTLAAGAASWFLR